MAALLLVVTSCTIGDTYDDEEGQHLLLTNEGGYQEKRRVTEVIAKYDPSLYYHYCPTLEVKVVFADVWDNYLKMNFDVDLSSLKAGTPIQDSLTYIYHEKSNEIHPGRDFYVKSGSIVFLSNKNGRLKLRFEGLELWYEAASWYFDGDNYHKFDVEVNGELDFSYSSTVKM